MTEITAAERVRLPAGLEFYAHQRECLEARRAGAQWMIWRHHRQSGKGRGALALTALEGFERPGTYAIISPTFRMARECFWDARDPYSGAAYLDVIPPELIVDRNENQQAVVMATRTAGATSRIIFTSADDADRLRGLALAGAVLDEFATMETADPLHVVRASLAASNGWLLITSTPKGMNHFYDVWKSAEGAGGWYLSTKTIEETRRHDGTPIISLAHVEQERREDQREEWIQQEYMPDFLAWREERVAGTHGERPLYNIVAIEVKYRSTPEEFLREDALKILNAAHEDWPNFCIPRAGPSRR